MSKKIISLTIDSNCISAKGNLPYMKKIESVSKKGLVEIYKTSNMDTEFFEGKGYQKGLSKSKDYKEDIGPGTWGVDRWEHFIWGSKFDNNRLENIKSILFKGRKNLSKKRSENAPWPNQFFLLCWSTRDKILFVIYKYLKFLYY